MLLLFIWRPLISIFILLASILSESGRMNDKRCEVIEIVDRGKSQKNDGKSFCRQTVPVLVTLWTVRKNASVAGRWSKRPIAKYIGILLKVERTFSIGNLWHFNHPPINNIEWKISIRMTSFHVWNRKNHKYLKWRSKFEILLKNKSPAHSKFEARTTNHQCKFKMIETTVKSKKINFIKLYQQRFVSWFRMFWMMSLRNWLNDQRPNCSSQFHWSYPHRRSISSALYALCPPSLVNVISGQFAMSFNSKL